MSKELKNPPPYTITSVDNALRIAAMLQLEGSLTLSEVAERLGVARSTAHRLLISQALGETGSDLLSGLTRNEVGPDFRGPQTSRRGSRR